MSLNVFVNNLTNRTNLMGYSGVQTSRFYLPADNGAGRAPHPGEHEPAVLTTKCEYKQESRRVGEFSSRKIGSYSPNLLFSSYLTTSGFRVVGEPLFSNQSIPSLTRSNFNT